jgi:hypothetical protein
MVPPLFSDTIPLMKKGFLNWKTVSRIGKVSLRIPLVTSTQKQTGILTGRVFTLLESTGVFGHRGLGPGVRLSDLRFVLQQCVRFTPESRHSVGGRKTSACDPK